LDSIEVPVVIVIPVFNDRFSCARLLENISKLDSSTSWQVCLVDDGSISDPPQISDLSDAGLSGVILRLARNTGHQSAIACGIGYVAANWQHANVLIMDADGEDRPEDIPALLSRLDQSTFDAVVATRGRRTEGWLFRAFYTFYKIVFRLFSGRIIQFGNFMALSKFSVRRLASMQETWLHIAAALIASKIPIKKVIADRGRRYAGQSSMSLVSLSVHGVRALMVFADSVFMRVLIACFATIAISVALSLVVISLKLSGNASPGWFTSAFGGLAIVSLQMAGISAISLVLFGITNGSIVRNTSKNFSDLVASVETTP
jgi:polyisoprenyl-phosphate glycosyltransferase